MTTTTDTRVDDMLRGYLECAIWAGLDYSLDDEGDSLPLDENYDVDDIADEAVSEAREDCAAFIEANEADLAEFIEIRSWDPSEGSVWDYVGHDFYLTRNHHGAGFWDRGCGPCGDRLTKAAHVYGTAELYPGGGGKLYFGG